MAFLDSLSLANWESVSEIGAVIVTVGVALEILDVVTKWKSHHHPKSILEKESVWPLFVESLSVILVVAGLVVEIYGTHRAMRIARAESDRLTTEAGRARKEAGDAIKLAGEANERAARANERSAILESNNLVLRSNVIALELRLQTRRVTVKQKQDFVELTKHFPKTPVKIYMGVNDRESREFAEQLRAMFDEAGFKIDSGDGIAEVGGYFPSYIGDRVKDASVIIVMYGNTQDVDGNDWPGVVFVTEGGQTIAHYSSSDARALPVMIDVAFHQIAIPSVRARNKDFLKPGEWGVFVQQKF